MNTIKIAFVYDAVYPYISGGVEKRLYEIGRRLSQRHEIHWYGVGWWQSYGLKKIMRKDGMYFHSVCDPLSLYSKQGTRRAYEALIFGTKLFPKLLDGKYDVIVSEQFPYLSCFTSRLVSSLRNSILVIDWHEVWGDYWFEYQGQKGLVGFIVEKMTSRLTQNNIAVSNVTRRGVEKLSGSKVGLYPNGVDLDRIGNTKPSDDKFDFIFVGRLTEEKGVDLLLQAMKLLLKDKPQSTCLIIGDGPKRRFLENLVTTLGIESNITFLGRIGNHDEVIAHMKSSKVFVIPSRREGFAIAAVEANACGIPIVTIDHPMNALKDYIVSDNGFICEATQDKLVSGMLNALDNYAKMRSACIGRANNYSWDSIARDYEIYLYRLVQDQTVLKTTIAESFL